MKCVHLPLVPGLALALLIASSASSAAHPQPRLARAPLPAQRFSIEDEDQEDAQLSVPVVLEGIVLDAEGAPAAGATVTSSAGGRAITGDNGHYRLETRVP